VKVARSVLLDDECKMTTPGCARRFSAAGRLTGLPEVAFATVLGELCFGTH
jgi:hypothetical protein